MAWLFAGIESTTDEETSASLTICVSNVDEDTRTVRLTTALSLAAISPSEQVIIPPSSLQGGVEVIKVTSLDRTKLTLVPIARDGPRLETCAVYASRFPAFTGSGVSTRVRARLAAVATSVTSSLVLFARFGSCVVEATVVLLVIEPSSKVVTTTFT